LSQAGEPAAWFTTSIRSTFNAFAKRSTGIEQEPRSV
jgi:hypothetical protein